MTEQDKIDTAIDVIVKNATKNVVKEYMDRFREINTYRGKLLEAVETIHLIKNKERANNKELSRQLDVAERIIVECGLSYEPEVKEIMNVVDKALGYDKK